MAAFFQYVIGGLAVGSIYGLVALGFVLIFKSTDVFNFAQGDLLTLGAYLLFAGVANWKLPMIPAILVSLVIALVIGVAMQVIVFRPMIGKPLLTVVMVTIALSLIIKALIQVIFGTTEKTLPHQLPNDPVHILGLKVSELELITMGVTALCVLAFALFFRRSKLGLQMRATAENVEASMLSGIDANRVFMVAFGLGTAIAALGGVLMANLQTVTPQLSALGLLAFPAAVLGGLTSIPGAIVGGLLIGVIQQLATGYVSGQSANVFVYGVLLAVLLIRPWGIFGRPTVARV
ncbi:MAG TPA: branched-chain amino acid ABC transporter permease [Baekduia sp.]|uniref:branched-chain amino acid ABC transporter permease n=1 Tax=Baekduia sp. TaxID=2600305 RepID=UPI002D78D55F|nr:branched-chain amino acid ABC transporter permease [Baekduia sp.]HET6507021.1 branched-chain amino acid ABC transporter permease [Baekduia sp.]